LAQFSTYKTRPDLFGRVLYFSIIMKKEYINSRAFFEDKYKNNPQPTPQLIMAAWELKTPENAGSIIRLAGNLGVEQVFFIFDNFQMRYRKIKKVAQSSLSHVNFSIVTEKEFWIKIPKDYAIVSLETTASSTNIFNTKIQNKTVIVSGNERFGLPQSFLNKCDSGVFIPTPGKTSSLNVSHAMTIAAFEWAKQNFSDSLLIR
jgi:tRNA (cytidine/uridine-2'-O-)-methyltransferase